MKMDTFKWYSEINNSNEIVRGDIIPKCYSSFPDESIYSSIISENPEIEPEFNLLENDLIVLSQSCDIKNEKIDSIVTCPIWELIELCRKNDYYNSTKGKENLRQGKEPAYHLLNKYSSNNINLPYSIVDFHRIYSLPKHFITKIAEKHTTRLRLLPPYREHLSQAFARYFMRVGLPLDISKDELKEIK